ncbi:MAG: OmpH family outer membrane protein [Muribaculaceae bacterium]|nr:OmpH family outer membrane protein [Muribaculaceae bacterium]MDE5968758.1 OmpH family outer membrane protein [Muribaculaceae bacterium]
MKKSTLFLTLISAATLAMTSCGGNNNSEAELAPISTDGVEAKMRFYNPDSVSQHYILIEELNTQVQADLQNYQAQERAKANELQRMGVRIQEKLQNNGYLSEASYNQDVQNFQAKQQQAEAYLAGLQQQIAEKTAEQSKMLLDSLNNFLADFNKQYNFDAILQIQAGSYVNPELDITDHIIKGLNERYLASHPEKKADDKKADDKKVDDKATEAKK